MVLAVLEGRPLGRSPQRPSTPSGLRLPTSFPHGSTQNHVSECAETTLTCTSLPRSPPAHLSGCEARAGPMSNKAVGGTFPGLGITTTPASGTQGLEVSYLSLPLCHIRTNTHERTHFQGSDMATGLWHMSLLPAEGTCTTSAPASGPCSPTAQSTVAVLSVAASASARQTPQGDPDLPGFPHRRTHDRVPLPQLSYGLWVGESGGSHSSQGRGKPRSCGGGGGEKRAGSHPEAKRLL